MGDMAAVLEPMDSGAEISTGAEASTQPDMGQQAHEEDYYSSKSSKDFSQWLKGLRDADPNNAKWARLAKDSYGRDFALKQLDPKGVDGVRERYALMDSVTYDAPDGSQLKGADAINALQDFARESAQIDEMIASGDPKVLEAFGEDFNDGLAKLAPALLDRVAQANPDAYQEAMTPHVVRALLSGPALQTHNTLVDLLNEKPPAWLPQDKLALFEQERMGKIRDALVGNGKWLNEQIQKAEGKLQANGQPQKQAQTQVDPNKQAEAKLQEHHWKTNIAPGLDKHAETSFNDLFRPFQSRLKLNPEAANAMKADFVASVVKKAAQNPAYMNQINRYHSQRNPDPAQVLNYAKIEFDKHAKSVLQSLVTQRYGAFLNGKPKTATVNQSGNGSTANKGPVGPKEYVVTVKPRSEDVDFKNRRFPELRAQNKFPMKNGRIAVWQH